MELVATTVARRGLTGRHLLGLGRSDMYRRRGFGARLDNLCLWRTIITHNTCFICIYIIRFGRHFGLAQRKKFQRMEDLGCARTDYDRS